MEIERITEFKRLDNKNLPSIYFIKFYKINKYIIKASVEYINPKYFADTEGMDLKNPKRIRNLQILNEDNFKNLEGDPFYRRILKDAIMEFEKNEVKL